MICNFYILIKILFKRLIGILIVIVDIIKLGEYLRRNKDSHTCKYYLYLIDIRRKNDYKQEILSYKSTRW